VKTPLAQKGMRRSSAIKAVH
jgi:hypothetical protein